MAVRWFSSSADSFPSKLLDVALEELISPNPEPGVKTVLALTGVIYADIGATVITGDAKLGDCNMGIKLFL